MALPLLPDMGGFSDYSSKTMAMTTDRVNHLNTALMVASAVAAFILPFEVFLVSYAVLGPLHYLTEISWLHDRQYFLSGKRDGLPLILLCVAALIVGFTRWSPDYKSEATTLITYLAFVGAGVLLVTRATMLRAIAFALMMLAFLGAKHSEIFFDFFGVFLPTIVHVFIFTGAFIALGALRGRSRSGCASVAIFAMCAASLLFFQGRSFHQISNYVRAAYAPFEHLNLMIFRTFHLAAPGARDAVYESAAGLAVMRFIAFAYLYHYLNWFSKTSIIGWNRISWPRALAIIGLWMASLWIYSYDARIGLAILLTLSFAHGFLELPLDHQTFFNLFKEMWALAHERFGKAQTSAEEQSKFAA